ncbi:MAG: type VI secretion system tube protein Hcp [Pseudolabrys sp.]
MKKLLVMPLAIVFTLSVIPGVLARGGGSHGARHSDLTVTKSTDTASPKMMKAATGKKTGTSVKFRFDSKAVKY